METEIKHKEKVQVKKTRALTVPYSVRAKRNVQKQMSAYMLAHGKKITVKEIAGKLLETATLSTL